MKKIIPWLWMDNEAEEAANFYVSIFPNSKINKITKYPTDTPSNKPIGSVMAVTFELDGNPFAALNGGTFFKLNEAVSFEIPCKDQEEIDYYWEKLSAVPESEQCGWVKDKFGVSWQIVPENMDELMSSDDPEVAKKKMEAMLKMKKIIIEDLKNIN
ncbi:MAG: VOC family protein [Candidatus Moraniibacteriota bacterium]